MAEEEYKTRFYSIGITFWLIFNAIAIWKLASLLIRTISVHPIFWFNWIFLVLMIIYASLYMLQYFRKERLFLSEEGIKYQTMFFTEFSTWENVNLVDKGSWGQERLWVQEPCIQPNLKWTRWYPLSKTAIHSKNFIPIGKLQWKRYSEIEDSIRKYMPRKI